MEEHVGSAENDRCQLPSYDVDIAARAARTLERTHISFSVCIQATKIAGNLCCQLTETGIRSKRSEWRCPRGCKVWPREHPSTFKGTARTSTVASGHEYRLESRRHSVSLETRLVSQIIVSGRTITTSPSVSPYVGVILTHYSPVSSEYTMCKFSDFAQ